jgi:hypothetical protein
MEKIIATYTGKKIVDNGKDTLAPDKIYYFFSAVTDYNNNPIEDKRYSGTALLKKSKLVRGERYILEIGDSPDIRPIAVYYKSEKYYKKGGSIIHVDKNGMETNLSR